MSRWNVLEQCHLCARWIHAFVSGLYMSWICNNCFSMTEANKIYSYICFILVLHEHTKRWTESFSCSKLMEPCDMEHRRLFGDAYLCLSITVTPKEKVYCLLAINNCAYRWCLNRPTAMRIHTVLVTDAQAFLTVVVSWITCPSIFHHQGQILARTFPTGMAKCSDVCGSQVLGAGTAPGVRAGKVTLVPSTWKTLKEVRALAQYSVLHP